MNCNWCNETYVWIMGGYKDTEKSELVLTFRPFDEKMILERQHWISEGKPDDTLMTAEIRYCPHCGRKLDSAYFLTKPDIGRCIKIKTIKTSVAIELCLEKDIQAEDFLEHRWEIDLGIICKVTPKFVWARYDWSDKQIMFYNRDITKYGSLNGVNEKRYTRRLELC